MSMSHQIAGRHHVGKLLLVTFLWLLEVSGVNRLFRFINKNRAIILWYHGVYDDTTAVSRPYGGMHIPVSVFRRQLNYLKKKGYSFVSLSDMIDALQHGKTLSKLVVLTFDDGYSNVVHNAYPVMKEFGASGCLYVVSSSVWGEGLLWPDLIIAVVSQTKGRRFSLSVKGQRLVYKVETDLSRKKAAIDIIEKMRRLSNAERTEHLLQFTLVQNRFSD